LQMGDGQTKVRLMTTAAVRYPACAVTACAA
jgi:hypothetical protein